MAGNVKAVPEGMHTITPHLVVRGSDQAIEFYKKAFGAEIKDVHRSPDGKVIHAAIKIGDSTVFMSDEFPEHGSHSPQGLGGSPVVLNIYVEGVDKLFNQAVAAGATVTQPLADQFWGDRYGQLQDPFGHRWSLASRIEILTSVEMERRGKAFFEQMAKGQGQSA